MRFGLYGKNRLTEMLRFSILIPSLMLCFRTACRADVAQPQTVEASNQSSSTAVDFSVGPRRLEIGLGASDLSGSFGGSKTTNINTDLVTASYRIDDVRLIASLPWMRIDSPGTAFTGIEGTPIIVDAIGADARKLREGLGDLTLGASYLLPAKLTQSLDVDTSFRIKIPTSRASSGISTGSVDYSFGLTASKAISSFAPIVSVFYRKFGNTQYFQLKDGVSTSIGAAYSILPKTTALVTYDYAQSASAFVSDSHQITSSLTSQLPNSAIRVTAFLSGGLSRGAPGGAAGLGLSLRL